MALENRLREMFDSLSQPVLLIDRDYRIVAANGAAKTHLKRSTEQIVGAHCFELTHGVNEPCSLLSDMCCPAKEAFETRRRARTIHKHRIDGRIVVEEITATPLAEGGADGAYVVEEFRNITELLDLADGLLFSCGSCKRIRDEDGNWFRPDQYIHDHTGADFSHSFCPDCFRRLFPEEGD